LKIQTDFETHIFWLLLYEVFKTFHQSNQKIQQPFKAAVKIAIRKTHKKTLANLEVLRIIDYLTFDT